MNQKIPATIKEQVQKLRDRGCVINDEKLAEQIWEEGNDEVLVRAFKKTDKDSLFWGEQTIERKNV